MVRRRCPPEVDPDRAPHLPRQPAGPQKMVEEVAKDLPERLGLSKVTFVGDRGILRAANREAI